MRCRGGRCRDRVDVYRHCNAPTAEEIFAKAEAAVAEGCRCVRVAYTAYDGPGQDGYLCLKPEGTIYDPGRYTREIKALLTNLRAHFGPGLGLITDVHERLDPADAVALAKQLEPLELFFLEDPLPHEQLPWPDRIRQVCAAPLAIGEVFVSPAEYNDVVLRRRADYIRCHLSAIGGLTPARKLAHLAEVCGVKTAWRARWI